MNKVWCVYYDNQDGGYLLRIYDNEKAADDCVNSDIMLFKEEKEVCSEFKLGENLFLDG